jgi:integrase/recombinase XerD
MLRGLDPLNATNITRADHNSNQINSLIERKISLATEDLLPNYANRLYKIRWDNALSITDFILSSKTEINLSIHHVIDNIPQLKRKEQSMYKPSDLWTEKDDLLFLKYCPSRRDKCYHMISRDTSCRPHEIQKLKIKDIVFKTSGKSQYAEVLVTGKTGSRHIPLINSIPYIKDWLDEHPQNGNPNAALICGFGKSLGRRLQPIALNKIYANYKMKHFPKLLQDPSILQEDKQKIKELLKKPWNPYIRRHSALTEKSTILKEHILRQHAGWSVRSNMPQKYIHYFGNESSESLLEAYGIVTKDQKLSDALRPKQCPNCNCLEPNKPNSKFCAKCRMVLTYDAYSETLEEQISLISGAY